MDQAQGGADGHICPSHLHSLWKVHGSLFKYLFISLFLAALGLRCHVGFSLVVTRKGRFSVGVLGLLIAAASLVVEQRLEAHGLQ